jgi:hypothetical protein
MKKLIAVFTMCLLGTAANADTIGTFKKTCLAHLGNPSAIIKAGSRNGFKKSLDLGGLGWIGSNKKTDLTLQVNAFTKHKFECAVTSPDVNDPKALGAAFFSELGLKPKRGAATGKVNGVTYVFMHDTKGGEALVVYAK